MASQGLIVWPCNASWYGLVRPYSRCGFVGRGWVGLRPVAGPGQGPCLCTFGLAFELLENLALAWHC